jgi:hypothetical protein
MASSFSGRASVLRAAFGRWLRDTMWKLGFFFPALLGRVWLAPDAVDNDAQFNTLYIPHLNQFNLRYRVCIRTDGRYSRYAIVFRSENERFDFMKSMLPKGR